MGKTVSKSDVVHNADPQIRIVNTQEYHTALLEQHELLIYVIAVVVVIHLLLTLYAMLKRRERKRAFAVAKSMERIVEV